MKWITIGASFVLSALISYLVMIQFAIGTFYLAAIFVVAFFGFYSAVTLLSSIFGTLRLLNEKPPFADKVEEVKSRIRAQRTQENTEQVQEVRGRLEQLVAKGKDPFETGIYNLDDVTKGPGKAQAAAKKPKTAKGKK